MDNRTMSVINATVFCLFLLIALISHETSPLYVSALSGVWAILWALYDIADQNREK